MPIALPIAAADLIVGAVKALAVLEAFSPDRQSLNATLAAERAGITRAAARRHLLTLAHLGYLEANPNGFFALAPRVLRLSGYYLASARVPRLVQPMLNRLALQTGLAYSVALADGPSLADSTTSVVIVARSVQPSVDRVMAMAHGLHLGARPPLHTTSTGRMLLAQLPAPGLRAWLQHHAKPGQLMRMTQHTLTDAKALRGAVAVARKADWAYVREENELGVHAMAIALRDAKGQTVAALNAVASVQTTTQRQLLDNVLPRMQLEAQALAMQL